MDRKEQILDSYSTSDWPMGMPYKGIYKAMQEHADEQTKELTDKIKALQEEVERLKNAGDDLKEASIQVLDKLKPLRVFEEERSVLKSMANKWYQTRYEIEFKTSHKT